ncbi:MAG: nucleotidyltransferase family protein [Persephonella sp.]|nr:nucleotidyltransferase family protein [Persephonella sp.]
MNNKELENIKKTLRSKKEFLKQNYKVKDIKIFGSYIRGEQTEKSDIDILVEFEKPISLIKFIELENYLSSILGKKVDLVSKKALKKNIKKRVLTEAIDL